MSPAFCGFWKFHFVFEVSDIRVRVVSLFLSVLQSLVLLLVTDVSLCMSLYIREKELHCVLMYAG